MSDIEFEKLNEGDYIWCYYNGKFHRKKIRYISQEYQYVYIRTGDSKYDDVYKSSEVFLTKMELIEYEIDLHQDLAVKYMKKYKECLNLVNKWESLIKF